MATRRPAPIERNLHALLVVLVCGFLTGCSFFGGDSEAADTTTTTTRSESDPEAGSAAPTVPSAPTTESAAPEPGRGELFDLLGPDDRIVVHSGDNNLSVLTFGGAVPAPTNSDANQPVFSGDGSVLAWSQLGASGAELVFADVGPDGSLTGLTEVPTPVLSFYSAFAPGASDRIAVLGNSTRGVGVAVVERGSGSTEVLDQGVPYFFIWGPDGDGFVGHVGTRLRTFDLESETGVDRVEVLPSFRAPALLADRSAVFVTMENGRGARGRSSIERIEAVAGEFDGSVARSVAQFDGLGSMSLSPDSSTLAVVVEGALAQAQVSNPVATIPSAARVQNTTALNRGLHLIDTATDQITTLVSVPVLAAFWAPNSELIASLSYDSIGDGRSWVRWTVLDLDGEVVSRSPRLLMTRLFATTYLPFYDQFERSSTPWSPDSTRLVFPGESMAGDAGIWLHRTPMAGDDAQTFLIADGVMALWSP